MGQGAGGCDQGSQKQSLLCRAYSCGAAQGRMWSELQPDRRLSLLLTLGAASHSTLLSSRPSRRFPPKVQLFLHRCTPCQHVVYITSSLEAYRLHVRLLRAKLHACCGSWGGRHDVSPRQLVQRNIRAGCTPCFVTNYSQVTTRQRHEVRVLSRDDEIRRFIVENPRPWTTRLKKCL